jgi:hypothetical protein
MDFFSLKVIYPVHLFEAPARSQKVHDSFTYKSLLWNDSGVQRLRVEIKHPDSIDENHIETFCAV